MSELNEIHSIYERLLEVRALEEKALSEAKAFGEAARKLEESLGDMFSAYGLQELSMKDGKKVSLKTDYYGTVSDEKMSLVREFLTNKKSEGILKPKKLSVKEEDLAQLPTELRSKVKYEIHHSTLKAFLKELDNAGELTGEVRDLFAVYQKNSVVLK